MLRSEMTQQELNGCTWKTDLSVRVQPLIFYPFVYEQLFVFLKIIMHCRDSIFALLIIRSEYTECVGEPLIARKAEKFVRHIVACQCLLKIKSVFFEIVVPAGYEKTRRK